MCAMFGTPNSPNLTTIYRFDRDMCKLFEQRVQEDDFEHSSVYCVSFEAFDKLPGKL